MGSSARHPTQASIWSTLSYNGGQFLHDLRIGRNLGESAETGQPVGLPGVVEAAQTVIPAPLHVQGRQVEASGSGGTEQEVANVIDDLRVNGLGLLGGPGLAEPTRCRFAQSRPD